VTYSFFSLHVASCHPVLSQVLDGGEAVGGVVASALGLTDSQFQYVIDSLEHEVSSHVFTGKGSRNCHDYEMPAHLCHTASGEAAALSVRHDEGEGSR
jgi:hypothetical protein